ncbi:DNA repair protein RecN [Mycobacterium intracellulare subsp. yongonense 05-1390]|uniref:DNA repair protein RecN n=1 Tax=Mycobacterium intracellulare TaxID=1767 RepID=UPI000355654C|nr:DNA repair protein RecN [Mycobacterium intracellulare]AGP64375.1 DNA repair protein RecN [Mycobacterium intracellulare subsp. yongonense 05-1390]ARR78503.1 DNA repair protein RecN [Mycobacterium intracellulare subsp. yongonense]ARR83580.1 DNA repair protein RecN [Mycobacterium intracellulare subsp. yongonense]OCB26533.1 DNA repair protein RecN [Mycobacterium intracellulare subsp. yongonense]PBA55999.1 DNA repair protein RecN [Mycobacterium intracellulare subsp. chimaera]
MLTEIRIESLGAISSAVGEFDRGLTVLTGETGTGKTMVVTGLHLLGGARADATRVRSGAERAVVEGRFSTTDLDEAMVVRLDEMLDASGAERDEDGSVIALRSVSRDGPSRAYLGGRSVPAKSLGDFTAGLLTLHGQNDQLRLIRPEEQCAALDRFAKAGPALERYCKLRDAWLSARRDLLDRRNRMRELALEADRLTFALGEIDAVDPQPGEDDALVAEIVRLSELDTLREAAATARAALSSEETDGLSATDSLGKARAALESTGDAKLTALAGQIGEVLTVLVDAAGELGGFLEELPVDASALESKLARQAELRSLTRKYAADIDGVIGWAQESRQRLAQLDVSEEGLAALAARVDELGRELAQAAVDLSATRRKAAKRLAKEVTAELSGLAMADAQFTIDVTLDAAPDTAPDPDDSAALRLPSGERVHAGADGVDQVEFGFAAHRGMDQLPLAKSASGGELSRVMLALEVVLATSRKEAAGTTMVFDEVDAGVGGRAAVQIGRRLARLARTHQVIVVTHLPQVAAYADVHLVVHAAGPKGTSVVRRLGGDERVAELARMLAGLGESDSGRAHARELLEAAQKDEI